MREQLRQLPFAMAFIAAGVGFLFAPAVTCAVIATMFFVLALVCVLEDRRVAKYGQLARGTVVGHAEEEDCFFPVIEFQDRDGQIRREVARFGRGVKQPPVGRSVLVVYDPTSKRRCEIDKFWRRSGFAVVLCLLGGVFVIGALLSGLKD